MRVKGSLGSAHAGFSCRPWLPPTGRGRATGSRRARRARPNALVRCQLDLPCAGSPVSARSPEPANNRRIVLGIAAAVVLALVVLLIVVLMGRGDDDTSPNSSPNSST